jgi:hypothetical protein
MIDDHTVTELRAMWKERERLIWVAYAEYWRKASELPGYKDYCDTVFRWAAAGKGWKTPEGRALNEGIGYRWMRYAENVLPEWKAYWRAQEYRNKASAACFQKNCEENGWL